MLHVEKRRTTISTTGEPVTRDSRVSRFVTGTNGHTYAVTIAPDGILIREKGKRTTYTVPYVRINLLGAQLMADLVRGEKPKRRRRRSLLRGR
jgi:hypothetical protein